MDENYENWQHLAARIIIEVIEDYYDTSDRYKKIAMLRWFDTPYGNSICELVGISPEVVKEEVQRNGKSKKNHIRNDYQRIEEIYQKRSKESQYEA